MCVDASWCEGESQWWVNCSGNPDFKKIKIKQQPTTLRHGLGKDCPACWQELNRPTPLTTCFVVTLWMGAEAGKRVKSQVQD